MIRLVWIDGMGMGHPETGVRTVHVTPPYEGKCPYRLPYQAVGVECDADVPREEIDRLGRAIQDPETSRQVIRERMTGIRGS